MGDLPVGGVYDWYVRGRALLDGGHPEAAAQLLARAVDESPDARSLRELLARAQFNAGWYPAAADNFEQLVSADPVDDYAQFGLGLACWRLGDLDTAAAHLALAVALRPSSEDYSKALTSVRATLRARSAG